MAEDVRRSAEIRRMASQKVAAELIKASTYATPNALAGENAEESDRKHFIDLVDWIDADVVAAGDRATATPTPTLPNGSEPVSEPANGLSVKAAATLTELLGRVDPELLKLKLWEKDLPFKSDGSVGLDEAVSEAVAAMDKTQAKELLPWLREHAKDE